MMKNFENLLMFPKDKDTITKQSNVIYPLSVARLNVMMNI